MKWLLGGFAATMMLLLAKKRENSDKELPVVQTGPELDLVRPPPGRHWTWAELSASTAARRLGLDNTPTAKARMNLRWMCAHVLDPLRDRHGATIRLTSAFRSPAVNRAVGGLANSRHLRGLAVDVVVPVQHRTAIVKDLEAQGLKVLVYEGHVHIAHTDVRR